MKDYTKREKRQIEDRVYELLLKDFGRMYFEEDGKIPVGTYVAPANNDEIPVIIAFFEEKGWYCTAAANGLYYVRFPKPRLIV